MKLNRRSGFTLLEVMIFTMILSMVLVTATSYITRLLVNIRANEHRTNAVFLAADAQEWLSGERDANDWTTFQQRGSVAGRTYCLNTQLNLNTAITALGSAAYPAIPPGPCATNASIQVGFPAIYRRQVAIRTNTAVPPTEVTAIITVSWVENGVPKTVTTESTYSSPF